MRPVLWAGECIFRGLRFEEHVWILIVFHE
jgi:hypothetical protein